MYNLEIAQIVSHAANLLITRTISNVRVLCLMKFSSDTHFIFRKNEVGRTK